MSPRTGDGGSQVTKMLVGVTSGAATDRGGPGPVEII